MKKKFICTFFALTAFLLFAQNSIEAREHRSASIRVNVGGSQNFQSYHNHQRLPPIVSPVRPSPQVQNYYMPVQYVPVQYAPVYVAPVQVVQQVRVVPAARPFAFGGLSFSWNFFR